MEQHQNQENDFSGFMGATGGTGGPWCSWIVRWACQPYYIPDFNSALP